MNNISKKSASAERHRRIETAAYYRAERRGFAGGDPAQDWLEAEREVDAAFSEKRHGLFEIWKGKGGRFVNQAHTALNGWVSRYRDLTGQDNKENSEKS